MIRSDVWIALILLGAITMASPEDLQAQDVFGEPGLAETENPDDMVTGTQNPDTMVAATEDPSSLEGKTYALPAPAPTLSPSGMVTPTQPLGISGTPTVSLSALPEANQADAVAERRIEEQVQAEQPVFPVARSLSEAQSQLSTANSRLENANAAVGKMLQRNYPRGEARARIYAEQKAAQEEFASASQVVEGFGGVPPDRGTAAPTGSW